MAEASKAATDSDISELRKVLAAQHGKSRQRKYDCIIGASGGLDSSYVIYLAKQRLGLNPLVVSYDHGFSHEWAFDNLKAVCKTLGVEYRILRSARRHDFKFVRSIVRMLKHPDAYWGVCLFCHYVYPAAVSKTALAEDIPIILTSKNVYESHLHLSIPFRLSFMARALLKTGIRKLPLMLCHLMAATVHLMSLKLEFYTPPVTNLLRWLPSSPLITINITKYVDWDIDSMLEILTTEAGWRPPPHPSLSMRFDCRIEDGFMNHTYKRATGLTVHGIIANNLIHGRGRSKHTLQEAVEYYDSIIDETRKQLMRGLKI